MRPQAVNAPNLMVSRLISIVWVELLLLSPAAAAPSGEVLPGGGEARSLLVHVAQTYAGLDRFHFEALETTETLADNFQRKTKTRYLTAADENGRARFAVLARGNEQVAVFDGASSWTYAPGRKQYTRRQGNPSPAARGAGLQGLDVRQAARRYTQRYAAASARLREARFIAEDSQPAGARVTVEAVYDTPPGAPRGQVRRRFRIDPKRGLVLHEVSFASMKKAQHPVQVRQEISFRSAVIGESVSAELFVFRPAPGAERVEQLGMESSFVAEPEDQYAPDFALQDFDGAAYRLEDLAGKVVLLDFWATWCKPCRLDLPRVDALASEFGPQGLIVLGINSESEQRSRDFFERQGYGFPSLVDRGARVARLYFVDSLPTLVIIDREGRVAAYLTGLHSAERLRAELAKVGLR